MSRTLTREEVLAYLRANLKARLVFEPGDATFGCKIVRQPGTGPLVTVDAASLINVLHYALEGKQHGEAEAEAEAGPTPRTT